MRRKYYCFVKALADRVVALILLILLSPLFLAVILLVLLRIGSPVFFRQVRPGHHGCPFYLLKFRTMTNTCDEEGKLLPDSQRLTPFGLWLRSTSIDELPELFNILCGQMSFVGPRPLLMQYLPLYSSEQARRHNVKPGLTGFAQINGRNAISWKEKFRLDVWYADHYDFWFDLRIIFCTFSKVIRRDGISAPGDVTMPLFRGNHND